MKTEHTPVVLVHGWKSHPGIWNRLTPRLEEASIPYWNFDHTGMGDTPLAAIALALQEFISTMRDEHAYVGPIDVVCHSVGTCISRYLLEVLDGGGREEQVRHLIGIGPPNNGSALSELFNDPVYGPQILDQLAGIFVPRRYEPADDVIAQEVRPGSRTMAALRSAGVRADVAYRFILSANLTATPDLFPCFDGKTWEHSADLGWRMTYAGDGIVPHTDSYLPGAGFDILPADPAALRCNPDQYGHIRLPRNNEVVDRVMGYLCDPATTPGAFFPQAGDDQKPEGRQ
jgi:pimeloyl-ACP methyl ester carboxylesterase